MAPSSLGRRSYGLLRGFRRWAPLTAQVALACLVLLLFDGKRRSRRRQTMLPGRGYWVFATEAATLTLANTGPPPDVAIASPGPGTFVTAPKVGNFTVSFTDLEVPIAGIPIQVIRTYDSRDRGNGDFLSFLKTVVP